MTALDLNSRDASGTLYGLDQLTALTYINIFRNSFTGEQADYLSVHLLGMAERRAVSSLELWL